MTQDRTQPHLVVGPDRSGVSPVFCHLGPSRYTVEVLLGSSCKQWFYSNQFQITQSAIVIGAFWCFVVSFLAQEGNLMLLSLSLSSFLNFIQALSSFNDSYCQAALQ